MSVCTIEQFNWCFFLSFYRVTQCYYLFFIFFLFIFLNKKFNFFCCFWVCFASFCAKKFVFSFYTIRFLFQTEIDLKLKSIRWKRNRKQSREDTFRYTHHKPYNIIVLWMRSFTHLSMVGALLIFSRTFYWLLMKYLVQNVYILFDNCPHTFLCNDRYQLITEHCWFFKCPVNDV